MRVASRPCRRARRSRSGFMRGSARAPSPDITASRTSSSIWCSRARAAATRARSEAIENVGGEPQCVDRRATRRHSTAGLLARDLPLVAELIADLVRAPHFDAEHLAREKKVILQELGESGDTRRRPRPRSAVRAAFADQPLGRSVLGERGRFARRPGRLQEWREQQYRPVATDPCRSGKVERVNLVALAERLFGDMDAGRRRRSRPRDIHWRRAQRQTRSSSRRTVASACAAPADRRPADAGARPVRPRHWEGGRLRGCSSSCGRSAASLIRSSLERSFAISGCSASAAPPNAREADNRWSWRERLVAETVESLSDGELQRARAQAEAGMLMMLETPQGQRRSYARRSIEVYGRVVEPRRNA